MCPCRTTSTSSGPPSRRRKRSWPRPAACCTSTSRRSAMATKVHMEALSPTMEEGRLVKWTKKEGDAVKSGETLAEVETDKAVMELVARADGQLLKVVVPEGTTVPVGNVVAWIGKPGEKVDGDGAGAPAKQTVSEKRETGDVAAAPAPAPKPAPQPVPQPAAAPADATR